MSLRALSVRTYYSNTNINYKYELKFSTSIYYYDRQLTVQQSLKNNFSTLYAHYLVLNYDHINMLFLLSFVHNYSPDPQTATDYTHK